MQWLIHIALVAVGGAAGALGRSAGTAAVASLVGSELTIAKIVGTFAVNVTGCFAMGAARAAAERGGWGTPRTHALVFSGFLGAFTTFSTFESDTMVLWEHGRRVAAGAYMGGSVLAGLVAFLAGWSLATYWSG